MPEALTNETLPLETSADGVIRVRGTRVTLDTVWAAFNESATAEEIVQQYPTLLLADAYEIRNANESRWPAEGIRARLLNRRTN